MSVSEAREATLNTLVTPALVVEKGAYLRNISRLRGLMANYPSVAIRPHAKAHKSGTLAATQLEALGPQAVGVCVQTVREAEEMVKAGVPDVLVTNQVVTAEKLNRLVGLAKTPGVAHLGVLVDTDEGLDALLRHCCDREAGGQVVSVWVEVDAGQGRCGVPAPPESEAVLHLARRILDAEGSGGRAVRFGGLQVYHGAIQFKRGVERRAEVEAGPVRAARAARELLEANGITVPAVSGGGTGTMLLEAAAGAHTEVQPGSYVFMDSVYGAALVDESPPVEEAAAEAAAFEQSLFVAATVISRQDYFDGQGQAAAAAAVGTGAAAPGEQRRLRRRLVVDAGTKAVDQLAGPPVVWNWAEGRPAKGMSYRCGGDEHGILEGPALDLQADSEGRENGRCIGVGDTVYLQPSHCDPTVNLHDQFLFVTRERDGGLALSELIEIGARGPGC
eukprot:CAMPEP_0172606872 /NCGR_PEP_ID=MMETSP1068-20121228/27073_1 /TAXON_ID=35684 /ORGANISM="Pseudopedinella elastica, Strain CCMP716" /LENGTH=446 /DNA_ID=CAMNT_0013409731 /DNA_START=232 /DNA_END=1572 /DNA_ORIENTATION=-